MSIKVYEGMFILDVNRYTRDQAGVPKQVEKLIQDAGGELIVSRLWEERRLAYPIKGQRKGVYWLTYFRIDGDQLKPMSRQAEINDVILRQMFLSIHPKLVDAIIAHALGQNTEEPSETEAEELETGKLETGKPEAGKLETGKPETGKPETGKPETEKPETEKLETGKLETGKPETEHAVDELASADITSPTDAT